MENRSAVAWGGWRLESGINYQWAQAQVLNRFTEMVTQFGTFTKKDHEL